MPAVEAGDIFFVINGVNINMRRMAFCTSVLVFGTGGMDHGKLKNGSTEIRIPGIKNPLGIST